MSASDLAACLLVLAALALAWVAWDVWRINRKREMSQAIIELAERMVEADRARRTREHPG